MRNEIQKAFLLSKDIMNFLDNYDHSEKITPKHIIDQFNAKYHQKFSETYLRFLIKIVQNYFEYDILSGFNLFNMIDWMWYLK